MKKNILCTCLILSLVSINTYGWLGNNNSGTSGFYFDFQGGLRWLEGCGSSFLGRGILGYDLNRFIGMEFGLSALEKKKSLVNYYTDDFNLLGKVTIPLFCSTSLHVKGGIGIIQSQYYLDEFHIKVRDRSHYYARPQAGLGFSYTFTPQLTFDFDYLRTFAGDYFSDSNFYGLGITIKLCHV